MSVGTPLIRRKFSLKCLHSRRSFIKFISFGLFNGSNLSSANSSLPTYQTSSNILFIPFDVSSRVISIIIFVISGLFITNKSNIGLNMSSVTNWASISINLKCRARISISKGGLVVAYGKIEFILSKNSGFRLFLNSVGLVRRRRTCKILGIGNVTKHIFWIMWTRDAASVLGICSWERFLRMKCSRILIYSGWLEKTLVFW